mmetsp:Transcript_23666/g.89857  ORF Transcript_23666/g.89857 Transcript_23666/m.89857 type:complete len:223 (-) Transcript_23666:2662-3330(-)
MRMRRRWIEAGLNVCLDVIVMLSSWSCSPKSVTPEAPPDATAVAGTVPAMRSPAAEAVTASEDVAPRRLHAAKEEVGTAKARETPDSEYAERRGHAPSEPPAEPRVSTRMSSTSTSATCLGATTPRKTTRLEGVGTPTPYLARMRSATGNVKVCHSSNATWTTSSHWPACLAPPKQTRYDAMEPQPAPLTRQASCMGMAEAATPAAVLPRESTTASQNGIPA